jgi:Methyltransferase domain
MPKTTALTAKTADVQSLYEHSVQSVDEEVVFIDRAFRKHYGKKPLSIREDFCGSGALATEWVKSDDKRRAVGVDYDPKVLAWAEKRHRSTLTPAQQKRLVLKQQDVRTPLKERFDCVIAYNYSWWIFKEWKELVRYFKNARAGLGKEGLFFLDIFGGSLSTDVSLEPRKYKGFTYIWEQAAYNPIDGNFLAHIHFEFKDGSRINKAFTYDWRKWNIPEAREALLEAGFSAVDVYWEKADDKGYPTGEFAVRRVVEQESSYNAYIVART